QHYCLRNCEHPTHLVAVDTWQGGEVLVKRFFRVGDVSPFLNAGVAVMYHDLRGTADQAPGGPSWWTDHVFPAAVVGGGVCYGWVCGEVNYYHGFLGKAASSGYPIATKAVAPMVSLRIPF
ncbi:MAG TPA: hypothetical protein VGR71_11660, partial [Nitrospira sp.]|nr:hypothetical protein [Nitrospira sp.]